jgi:hypothetical protein
MIRRAKFLAMVSAFVAFALAPSWAAAQANDCSISSSPPSGPTTLVAPGTQVTLTAICMHNPTTYHWNTGATTQAISVTALANFNNQYTVTGTNSAGANTVSYTINVDNGGGGPPPGSTGTLPTGPVTDAGARVSGSIVAGSSDGGTVTFTFNCLGLPTCTGLFSGVAQDSGCSNAFALNDKFVIAGLDLAHPGPIQGSFGVAHDWNSSVPSGGVCNYALRSGPISIPYAGTWNGTSGVIAFTATDSSGTFQVNGTFTAAVTSPVFPMKVSGSIDPVTANISAQVQPRPQDTGTNASIYVFAHAPSNLVGGALPMKRGTDAAPQDGAIVCVLAQVDASGRLTLATASTMQAYLTGVLTSQSQAVNILNNVATPNVAGASMFVGYGSSAESMLASGVFQVAVNVTGNVQCTASIASAPKATTPASLSGLWWNAAESGWGIHFTQRGAVLFAAWYTYDAQGNPKWYVAPNCPFSSSEAVSGNCTSALYEVAGPAFFGHEFNPDLVHASAAGTLQLAFQNTNAASMTYTVGTQTRTVSIVRQIFPVAVTTTPAVDFTDLWWNKNESGWGMAVAHQYGNVFLAWYVYDPLGKPVWYVAPSCAVSGSSCSGALYRTTGPAFGPPLDPSKVQAFPVGSAIVSFIDANNAVLSFTVDGVSATKTITRQVF